jgi:hypothetical protein
MKMIAAKEIQGLEKCLWSLWHYYTVLLQLINCNVLFSTLSIQPKLRRLPHKVILVASKFITQSYFVANCFSKFAMI